MASWGLMNTSEREAAFESVIRVARAGDLLTPEAQIVVDALAVALRVDVSESLGDVSELIIERTAPRALPGQTGRALPAGGAYRHHPPEAEADGPGSRAWRERLEALTNA